MGSNQSVKPTDASDHISTSENEVTEVLVESCCMKNVIPKTTQIIYIKKHFHDCLLPEQRKRLNNL